MFRKKHESTPSNHQLKEKNDMYEQPQSHALATTIPVKENRVYVKIFDWKLADEIKTRKHICTKTLFQRSNVFSRRQIILSAEAQCARICKGYLVKGCSSSVGPPVITS